MKQKILCVVLSGILLLAGNTPILAAGAQTEQEAAAGWLLRYGVMAGDQSGNMNLGSGLTRAELAVLLSRITVNPEHLEADRAYYASRCTFTDVPEWARPYVGFCVSRYLVSGYGNGLYGPNDAVTPAAACATLLRCIEGVGNDWTYDTACQKAVELGLARPEMLTRNTISRGNMAVLIYHTMAAMGYDMADARAVITETSATGGLSRNADGSINVPSDGSRYVPQAGDVIRCNDGTNYTIKDVRRWEMNISPLPDLPSATCDWSKFPALELPEAEVRHFTDQGRDMLFVKNLYETRRMQYTIYNTLGKEPSAWMDGKPLATVQLTIPADLDPYTASMWPWHDSDLENMVHSRPNSEYYIEAWDYYLNGVFQHTRYNIVSL